MPIRRTGENNLHEPQGNDYGYNEGEHIDCQKAIKNQQIFDQLFTNGLTFSKAKLKLFL